MTAATAAGKGNKRQQRQAPAVSGISRQTHSDGLLTSLLLLHSPSIYFQSKPYLESLSPQPYGDSPLSLLVPVVGMPGVCCREVPWKLRGPAGSQQQLVDSLAASPAAADAVPNAVMAPIKSEPQEASQRASKKIQKQQEQKQPQGKPHKKKQGSKDSGSTGNYAATNTAEPQTEGSPIKRKAASGFVGSAKGHERQQYPKQKQQGQGNEGKKARHS